MYQQQPQQPYDAMPFSARSAGGGYTSTNDIPLSARSMMSNAADDVSTLHYYRAQQRKEKKDTLLSNTSTVQAETVQLLEQLGARLKQHHTLGVLSVAVDLLRQEGGVKDVDVGTVKSEYFTNAFLTSVDALVSNSAAAIPDGGGGSAAASSSVVVSPRLAAGGFVSSAPKEFVRIESFIQSKESILKQSQQAFSHEMGLIGDARTQLDMLTASLGVSDGGQFCGETISDMPLYKGADGASSITSSQQQGGGRTGSPPSCSKLDLAKERVRHLKERLCYLEQQTPKEADADFAAFGEGAAGDSAATNGHPANANDEATARQASGASYAASDSGAGGPLSNSPLMLAASVDTAGVSRVGTALEPATDGGAAAGGSNNSPMSSAFGGGSPASETSPISPATALSPLEQQHKKRLDAERTKLTLLSSRHSKLSAVKALMVEEAAGRRAITKEWEGENVLGLYLCEVVSASSTIGGGGSLYDSQSSTEMISPRDAPMVPSAATDMSGDSGPTPASSPAPAPSHRKCTDPVAAYARFKAHQDSLVASDVKRLQGVYSAKVREYDALEERAGMLKKASNGKSNNNANGGAAADGAPAATAAADRIAQLKATLAAQEAEISEQQDLIVSLEHDLSPEGDYVDLDAMLVELRPQGPETSPPMGHEASSTLGKMAQWAASYGNHLIDCAKEMAMAEAEAIRLAQLIANLEVERSDYTIRAQYKGAHSYEQQQLDALDRFRELELALQSAEKEAGQLRINISDLEERAKDRQTASDAIDASRRVYFGREAALEGEKRDLQREVDQMSFVLESVKRALASVSDGSS